MTLPVIALMLFWHHKPATPRPVVTSRTLANGSKAYVYKCPEGYDVSVPTHLLTQDGFRNQSLKVSAKQFLCVKPAPETFVTTNPKLTEKPLLTFDPDKVQVLTDIVSGGTAGGTGLPKQ